MSLTDDFSDTAMAIARAIAAHFTKPDDDFVPVVVVGLGDRMVLIPASYSTLDEKYGFWDHALPAFIRAKAARQVTFVASMWALKPDPADAEAELAAYQNGSLEAHPRRREVVLVISVTAHGAQVHMADIMRSANMPPFITEFELLPPERTQLNLVTEAQRALACVTRGSN
jgi:hypothetical protein